MSNLVDEEQYVLRYWETEFEQLRPQKNRAGNRIYNEKDVDIIRAIQTLLRTKRFTIDGAKEHLKAMQFEAKNVIENAEDSNRSDTPFADTHTNGISPETLIVAPAVSSTTSSDDTPTLATSALIEPVQREQVQREQVRESADEPETLNIPLQEADSQHETHPQEALDLESRISIVHPLPDSHQAEQLSGNNSDNSIISDSSSVSATPNATINSLSERTSSITLSREELVTIRDTLRSILRLLSGQPTEVDTFEASSAEHDHFPINI